ncbi:unnamed protein product [Cuscuta epithymum]|uniref:Uncharacterized protein n=1 Tax=Cuscuta epithymum TaxID=186058 RepID=A0AAV0D671_9ASTE|nr:unnamed protein product [Cuscuta epithymum]
MPWGLPPAAIADERGRDLRQTDLLLRRDCLRRRISSSGRLGEAMCRRPPGFDRGEANGRWGLILQVWTEVLFGRGDPEFLIWLKSL